MTCNYFAFYIDVVVQDILLKIVMLILLLQNFLSVSNVMGKTILEEIALLLRWIYVFTVDVVDIIMFELLFFLHLFITFVNSFLKILKLDCPFSTTRKNPPSINPLQSGYQVIIDIEGFLFVFISYFCNIFFLYLLRKCNDCYKETRFFR